jgi:hypothetical protein
MGHQTVRKTCKHTLRPKPEQERMLERTAMLRRQVKSAAVEERREAWRMHGVSLTFPLAKARGCSGNAHGHPSRSLLKGLPGPAWSGHGIARRAMRNTAGSSAASRVQDGLLRFPTGTADRGEPQERPTRSDIGTAQVSDSALLPHWRDHGHRTGSALSPGLSPPGSSPGSARQRRRSATCLTTLPYDGFALRLPQGSA